MCRFQTIEYLLFFYYVYHSILWDRLPVHNEHNSKKARLEEEKRLTVDIKGICEKTMLKLLGRSEKVTEGESSI